MVRLLIGAGANVDLCDRKQNTPLHWASQKGSVEIVEILLKAHANPNCINHQVTLMRIVDREAILFVLLSRVSRHCICV
jgi:ankyrin repeat protein